MKDELRYRTQQELFCNSLVDSARYRVRRRLLPVPDVQEACREETHALSERLTTLTIRMRQVEIENMDLKKSKEGFDRIIERKNREMMMKEEELKTYIAQQENAVTNCDATQSDAVRRGRGEQDEAISKLQSRILQLEAENEQVKASAATETAPPESDPRLLTRLRHLESENQHLKDAVAAQKEAVPSHVDAAHVPQPPSQAQDNFQQQHLNRRIKELELTVSELEQENLLLKTSRSGTDLSNKKLSQELLRKEEELRGWEHNWIKTMDASALVFMRRRVFKTKSCIFERWHTDAAHAKRVRDVARKLILRMKHFSLAICLETWSEATMPDRNFNHAVSVVAAFNAKARSLRQKRHAFVLWWQSISESRRQLNGLARLTNRCKGPLLQGVFLRWAKHAEVCVRKQRLGDRKIWQMYKMLRRVAKNALVRMQIWALDSKQRRTRYHRIVGKIRFWRLDASFKHLCFKLSKTRLRRQATNTLMRKWRSAAHQSTDLMNKHLEDEEVMGWKLQRELERWIDGVEESWLRDVKFLNERWQEHVRLLQVQERLRASGLRAVHKMMKRDLAMAFNSFCQVPNYWF